MKNIIKTWTITALFLLFVPTHHKQDGGIKSSKYFIFKFLPLKLLPPKVSVWWIADNRKSGYSNMAKLHLGIYLKYIDFIKSCCFFSLSLQRFTQTKIGHYSAKGYDDMAMKCVK